ncbi:hypothetical protein ETD86_36355 [Nonomuraea turkmeniaca]|uniref:Effector-associated domain-containing protein n=1 Tax=Nonomuraea turkmeniaca TaxID=103838 RepID=A0A5S4FPW1_9ACTN|nr:hypothetical protein [Nonomuraea turkmeniaca]TMR11259.1 hypothetical protein ETD86_36355 [Nonomuraea turkmeniaca]
MSRAGAVRNLINDALSEREVRDLALDYFYPVHKEFSDAMSRPEIIRRLVVWCDQHGALDELIERVGELNPAAVAAFTDVAEPARTASVTRARPFFIAHPLPAAPAFVGRATHLEALERFAATPGGGLFCLVALGGAGKTALVAEYLDRVRSGAVPVPDSLFVWSFYDDPDTARFMGQLYAYLAPSLPGGRHTDELGEAGWFYHIVQAFEQEGRHVIVLDGLERVQVARDAAGRFGDITDPMLAQLVRQLAAGLGNTKAVITSRFPLTRIEPWIGRTVWMEDVTSLTPDEGVQLLRRRGVTGTPQDLTDLAERFGAHALTLDHLGSYLAAFCDGNPAAARDLPQAAPESASPQERRLASCLMAYERALPEGEVALLSRLSVYRFAIAAGDLAAVFATASDSRVSGPLAGLAVADFQRLLQRLADLHLVLPSGGELFTVHPAVRDHFYRRFLDARLAHEAVRRRYSSLVAAPGPGLPRDDAALDVLEELIHHTLSIGRSQEAADLFLTRLGGTEHLAWALGQYGRCIRIMEQFPRCPHPGGLLWCLRALGDLEAARRLAEPGDLWWQGMLGCLEGRLNTVADLLQACHEDPILTICEVLTGRAEPETLGQAPHWPGLPISIADAWLAVGRPDEAAAAANAIPRDGWNDETARADLILAEVARRQGELGRCQARLDKTGQWVMRSGSQEHLCLLHLLRGRLAIDNGDLPRAATVLRQGIHVAQDCGFGLTHIELQLESARLALEAGDPLAARAHAQMALHGVRRDDSIAATDLPGADHPDCRYQPGIARATEIMALVS